MTRDGGDVGGRGSEGGDTRKGGERGGGGVGIGWTEGQRLTEEQSRLVGDLRGHQVEGEHDGFWVVDPILMRSQKRWCLCISCHFVADSSRSDPFPDLDSCLFVQYRQAAQHRQRERPSQART